MFGHDDNTTEDANTTTAESEVVAPTADATPTPPASDDTTTAPAVVDDQPAADQPTADTPEAEADAVPVVTPDTPVDTATPAVPPADASSLLSLKQEALQQLTPLVGHLDQPAEEKFRTTMMMIQAADDSTLVQTAYDAALKIEDEKVRAQALLDIVNEINYFTQSKTGAETPAA